MYDFKTVFRLLGLITAFLPAIAGLICYRRLSKAAKILALYFILIAFIDYFTWYLVRAGFTNIWLYHFFDPLEYLAIALAFSYWMGSQKLAKALRISILGFFIISLANSLRMQDIYHYSYAALSIAYLVYVFVSSFAIYKLINEDKGSITANPIFWLAASLLIMSANNELWYAFHDAWVGSQYYKFVFYMHAIVNIISYIFSTVGILIYKFPIKRETVSGVEVYWS